MTTSSFESPNDFLAWDDSMAEMTVEEVMADITSKLTGDPSRDATTLVFESARYHRHPKGKELTPLLSEMLMDACRKKGEHKKQLLRKPREEASILDETMHHPTSETFIRAPVLSLRFEEEVRYPNGDTLMGLEITCPVFDEDDRVVDRAYVDNYPILDSDSTGVYQLDPDGEIALKYGVDYYCEGMGYVDPADRSTRIECFQAAELLYRHAAARGNVLALLNLGYLYSYDRCEGDYWDDFYRLMNQLPKEPFSRERRAFECFEAADAAGIGEASLKLGDLYRFGIGCEDNARKAYACYQRALDKIEYESAAIAGSIALRFGECHEEGFGCEQSFESALGWYERAAATLKEAVEAGDTWYERSLARARAGLKRCRQEVG